jgi:hypothetical protein
MGTKDYFAGVKRQGCEAGAELKNGAAINLTPSYVFIAWCLNKPRDNLMDGALSLTTVLISGSEVKTPSYIKAVSRCFWQPQRNPDMMQPL